MKNTKEEITSRQYTDKLIDCIVQSNYPLKNKETILNIGEALINEYTSHLTDQIKSMENYISDVDGQVKELKWNVTCSDVIIREAESQLESLQKEKQSDVVEFAEWLEIQPYRYHLINKKWYNESYNDEWKTTQQLYEIFKSNPPPPNGG